MTASTAPVAAAPPLRRNRNFSLLWFGEGVSVLGSMTTTVVFPLIAVTHFRAGPGWMGVLAGAVWLPWLLLGLHAGAWVDRSDPRRVMMTADLVAAAAVTSIPVAWLMGRLTLPHLALAALSLGGCTVFFRTAYTAIIPRVVAPTDLERANARLFGTESAMQIAGPGVGGLLVQLVSAAFAVVLDAVTFVVSFVCLARMRPGQQGTVPDRAAAQPLRGQIGEGIRIVVRDPYLRFFAIQGGLGNFALTGYGALLVLFMVRDLGLTSSGVGVVMASGSAGGLAGAAIARHASEWLGSAGALRWLQVLGGPPALLVGFATPGWGAVLVAIGSALVGTGVVAANVVRSSFRLRYTPADLLGRTTATTAVLNFGTMPAAGVVAGALGTLLGVRETILLMTAVQSVSCLAVFVGPFGRGRELPTRPAAPQRSGR